MTLILGLTSKETIWLMADRRLTTKDGKIVSDKAVKLVEIETQQNDIALIGYAGLGATAKRREISDWMNAALRGKNLPLGDLLKDLEIVIKNQLPKYLLRFGINEFCHSVVIPSFNNNHTKLYSIDLTMTPKNDGVDVRLNPHVVPRKRGKLMVTQRYFLAGTGGSYLKLNKKWIRPLLSLTKKSDRGTINPEVVANELSKINYDVSKNISDKTVGPNCIVIWRNRRQGVHKGGGSHKFYTGDVADKNSPAIPALVGGMDVKAITDILLPMHMKHFEDKTEVDYSLINDQLSQIPDMPSEEID